MATILPSDDKATAKATEATVAQVLKTASRDLVNANESKTRVALVDRILGALGWGIADTEREEPSGTGNYLDYELRADGRPWLLVEAKRLGSTFELPTLGRSSHTSLVSLKQLRTKGNAALRETLDQAATYCNDRGIPLATITNGFQWVFFRGLSRRDRPWIHGAALTFSSPAEVLNRFEEFHNALSRQFAHTQFLYQLLDQPGHAVPNHARRPREVLHTYRKSTNPAHVAGLRTVADILMSDIYGQNKGEMLERCYVEPGASTEFAQSIQRLLRDSETPVERLGAANETLAGDTVQFVGEISRREKTVRLDQPVVVVGHVGAGKTTFIHRALGRFRDEGSAFFALVDLEGFGKGGHVDNEQEERRVSDLVTEKLGRAALTALRQGDGLSEGEQNQADPDSADTLRTIFREEIRKEKALGERLWSLDPVAWPRAEFDLIKKHRGEAYDFLLRYVRHLRARFRQSSEHRYPVLVVLDNLDQATDEYQRVIYGLAQRIAKATPAVVVVSIREDTYRRGLAPGGFLTSSSLPFVFHVEAPPLDRVIKERVRFAKLDKFRAILPAQLKQNPEPLDDFCRIVETVLLGNRADALSLLACLSGSNVRSSLDLVRSVVVGTPSVPRAPEPSGEFAIDALLATLSDEQLQARRVLTNCFDADPTTPAFHGLRARLLAYFSWSYEAFSTRPTLEATSTVVTKFAEWGYPVGAVTSALGGLRAAGLLRAYDESEHGRLSLDPNLPSRLTITATGSIHLNRLLPIRAYRAAMALITPWYDELLFSEFIARATAAGTQDGPTVGDIAASSALDAFNTYIAKMLHKEDAFLVAEKTTETWQREVFNRTSGYLPNDASEKVTLEPPPELAPPQERQQLSLLPDDDAGPTDLPTLPQSMTYGESVWLPRILWALEFARLKRFPPQSATDIAKILDGPGGVRVPNTNVARAFRDLAELNRREGYWTGTKKRYQISATGTRLIRLILTNDP